MKKNAQKRKKKHVGESYSVLKKKKKKLKFQPAQW